MQSATAPRPRVATLARARRLFALPLAVFAWLAVTAWLRPLAMPDEGRYLSVAWEMLQRGDWTVPTLDGLPFFHKPPLFYWLADAAMAVLGATPFAGRMPSLLAATGLAVGLHAFTARWGDARSARFTLLVLCATPFFYLGAQYANMDMLVAACISGAVLCAADALLSWEHGRDGRLAVCSAYALAGLGVLAKGLIGAVLPALVILVWLATSRRLGLVRRLVANPGVVVFAAVALPWPLAMQARYPGFFDYFILEQHVRRFASAGFNNQQPWWFYAPVLLAFTLPWSLGVVGAFRRLAAAGPVRRGTLSVTGLMVCWLAVVLVFFSLPQSKLVGYALPAMPPFVWLLAHAISPFARRHVRAIAGASALATFAVIVTYGLHSPHSAEPLAQALARLRHDGETVAFVDTYPYDVEFGARVRPPILVVKDWDSPEVARHDNWAKEIADEARFAPEEARRVLVATIPPSLLRPGAPRLWVVSPAGNVPPAGAAPARAVAHANGLVLWQVDP